MEAVSIAWLCGFKSAGKELEFRFEKVTNFGTIGPRSSRDRATIRPRSGHNLRLGRSSVGVRSSGGDSAAEASRLRVDPAAIAARSSHDLGVLPEPLHAVRSIIRRLEGHDRAIAIHSPRPSDGDPTVLMRHAATCLTKIN